VKKLKSKITPLKFLVIIVLLLDFAALDDITTGTEPYKWEEWDFLLLSLIFFGLVIFSKYKKTKK
jgi:hypothetical protein